MGYLKKQLQEWPTFDEGTDPWVEAKKAAQNQQPLLALGYFYAVIKDLKERIETLEDEIKNCHCPPTKSTAAPKKRAPAKQTTTQKKETESSSDDDE